MSAEPSNAARFQLAINRFDAENARDPNREICDGDSSPRELLYSKRLSEWVLKLSPGASETLRLAARCQHLCRWMIPRNSYEMTRAGYLRWRAELRNFHAQKASEILREVGCSEEVIQKVQDLNLKKNFPNDPESRVLEDALCLVFLKFQFAELASKTDDDKMVNALQKCWKKMSPQGREEALSLSYAPNEKRLLGLALRP